jgi:ELWxxDGT repeat protein
MTYTVFINDTTNDNTDNATLWRVSGDTVQIVKDPSAGGPEQVRDLFDVDGQLYFVTGRSGIWTSDGTSAGTSEIIEADSATGPYFPFSFVGAGGTVFFGAFDDTHGSALWKTDGTAEGTVLVKDVDPQNDTFSPTIGNFTDVGGTLYFSALNEDTDRYGLWMSDGSADSTVQVKEFDANTAYDGSSVVVDGELYFETHDRNDFSLQVWKSDGTEAGTVQVTDAAAGGPSFVTSPIVVIGSTLYFSAEDPINGNTLWKSDGTPAGTEIVEAPADGGPTGPLFLVNAGGVLYFDASDAINGEALWRSDGTAGGTEIVQTADAGGFSGRSDDRRGGRQRLLRRERCHAWPRAVGVERHRRRHAPCRRHLGGKLRHDLRPGPCRRRHPVLHRRVLRIRRRAVAHGRHRGGDRPPRQLDALPNTDGRYGRYRRQREHKPGRAH